MNRYPLLIALSLVMLAVIALLNCADPLEVENSNPAGGSTQVPDTVYQYDTLIDTVTNTDTVINTDTVVDIDTVTDVDTVTDTDTITVIDTVTDTVITIDTVIIVMPDTGTFRPLCSRLASNQQEIVWMFRNPAGNFRLEFMATVEKAQPNQTLTVTIDGVAYQWDPNASTEFIVEQALGQYATITVVPNKPPAHGHSIDVCLTVTAL